MARDKNIESLYLDRCVQLAKRGGSTVQSNPNVGAIIVYKDRIIGEGWHQQYGGLHAEREAINNVKLEDQHLLSQSHMYVSLEPCNHVGKTPACTTAIIEYKIPKVTIATFDPSDPVSYTHLTLPTTPYV